LKILIIDNSLALTGAFKCAYNEAEMLRDKHEFIFVLPERTIMDKFLEEKGFKVYKLPLVEIAKSLPALMKYFPALFANTIRLNKIVKAEKIDVIQANDFYNMLGVMMKKWMGFKGKLITYVRFLPDVMPGKLKSFWLKMAHKYSYKVISVSNSVLKQIPAHPTNVLIYDPVKLTETLPEKINTYTPVVHILYLSNYIRGKGQQYALEAFAKAYEQNKNIRMRYTGGDMGLEKNKQFKKELEDRAVELGLDNVVSCKSFSPDSEAEIKLADIFLNFSMAESFSMTCLEASFYGTALIATRCGGPEEIVVDKETGLLVPVADVDAMRDAILTLANDADLRNKYATAAKKHVKEQFSVEKFIDQFQSALA
jgi:glycosyltransferase involved in cell wall biosynthesis